MPVASSSLRWGQSSISVAVGEVGTVSATATSPSGMSYSVGDSSIATVSPNSSWTSWTITGVSAGTTTVTVTGAETDPGALTITVTSVDDQNFLNERGLARVWNNIDTLKQDTIGTGDIVGTMLADATVGSDKLTANAVWTTNIKDAAVTSDKIDWTTIPQGTSGSTQQSFKGYFDIGNIRVQFMNLRQTGLNTAAYGYNIWQATWPASFGNDWYCAVANATSDTGNVAGNDLKVTGRTTTTVQINYNHVTAIGGSEVYYSVIGIGLKPS